MGAPTQTTSTARRTGELLGHASLQLISVCVIGGDARRPPCGTVVAFDGKRGQNLYCRRREQLAPSRPAGCDAQGVLSLAGPYRAISADEGVAIELDLYYESDKYPDLHSEDDEAESIFWDGGEDTKYNKPITTTVPTGCGPVEVTYIVWSNAAEGSIQARLIQRDDGADPVGCIHGRIAAAYSSCPNDEVVLFNHKGACCAELQEDGDLQAIPLARSVIVAPSTDHDQFLTITVDLCDHSGREIVRGSLLFHPDELDRQQQRLVGRNGDDVVVTIAWSD